MKDVKNIFVLLAKWLGAITLITWLVQGTLAIYFNTFHVLGWIVAIVLAIIVAVYIKPFWRGAAGNIILVAIGVLSILSVAFGVLGAILHSGILAMGLGAIATLAIVSSKPVKDAFRNDEKNKDNK